MLSPGPRAAAADAANRVSSFPEEEEEEAAHCLRHLFQRHRAYLHRRLRLHRRLPCL